MQKRAVVLFLLGSGLRADEFCSLAWRDLEYDEDTDTWYANGTGKGGKPFHAEIAYPEALELFKTVFKSLFRRLPGPEDRLVYKIPKLKTYRRGGKECATKRPFNTFELWAFIKGIGEEAVAAGVTKREIIWSPHMVRRTGASLLSKAGATLPQVQAFMRHSNPTTTIKHYIIDDDPLGPVMRKAVPV